MVFGPWDKWEGKQPHELQAKFPERRIVPDVVGL